MGREGASCSTDHLLIGCKAKESLSRRREGFSFQRLEELFTHMVSIPSLASPLLLLSSASLLSSVCLIEGASCWSGQAEGVEGRKQLFQQKEWIPEEERCLREGPKAMMTVSQSERQENDILIPGALLKTILFHSSLILSNSPSYTLLTFPSIIIPHTLCNLFPPQNLLHNCNLSSLFTSARAKQVIQFYLCFHVCYCIRRPDLS